jgi:hypothetical protein
VNRSVGFPTRWVRHGGPRPGAIRDSHRPHWVVGFSPTARVCLDIPFPNPVHPRPPGMPDPREGVISHEPGSELQYCTVLMYIGTVLSVD